MSEVTLTADERRCLQMWFRQAIAEVEKAEVFQALIERDGLNKSPEGHRTPGARRRRPRTAVHFNHLAKVRSAQVSV
ncbi:MAG: hypothetical protein K2X81_25605 [Candidatus Obscuribacterales bacterium]|nr:hypothetical protein [Candidatus Obscuribacterales bacterium]